MTAATKPRDRSSTIWSSSISACRRRRQIADQIAPGARLIRADPGPHRRGSIDDRVEALDCGADDFLVKPFNHIEFLAVAEPAAPERPHRASASSLVASNSTQPPGRSGSGRNRAGLAPRAFSARIASSPRGPSGAQGKDRSGLSASGRNIDQRCRTRDFTTAATARSGRPWHRHRDGQGRRYLLRETKAHV